MRVITGKAKGKNLQTLPGSEVRPTSGEVKEAIFNIIQFDLEGAVVLDLFCGSGQIGIEAVSRGAEKAVFVDNSPESIKVTKKNIAICGFEDKSVVINMPNSAFLRSSVYTFDIAVLDPPYRHGLIQKSLPKLAEIMTDNGIIVCEHERNCILPETAGKFIKDRIYNHGKTSITVYRKVQNKNENSYLSGKL